MKEAGEFVGKNIRKLTATLIAVTLIILTIFSNVCADDSNEKNTNSADAQLRVSMGDEYTYNQYLADNAANKQSADKEIILYGSAYESCTMINPVKKGNSVKTDSTGEITYSFDLVQPGYYNIELGYYPTKGSSSAIVRTLLVNGELPFSEADRLIIERIWKDENKDFLMVTDKNQAFPAQVEAPEWTTKILGSSDKKYIGPFEFYFKAGKNTITLVSDKEPMEIGHIRLRPAKELIKYQDYIKQKKDTGAQVISSEEIEGGAITIQGEDAYSKTTSILTPENDRTSSKTQPYHYSNIVLNTIGGENWVKPGDGINWKIKVPKAGLYKFALRYKQSYNRDFYSIREVKINGEVPFYEAGAIKFDYKPKYQVNYLGNETEDYYFYLEEGENTIALTVALGELGQAITQVETTVKNFNNLYRRLVAVMGTTPDNYRDYKITTSISDMMDIIQTETDRLYTVMDDFGDTLENGVKTSEIATMLYQLEKLIEKPDKIARELSTFSENISALSKWAMSLGEQYLSLDYIMVCGEGYELPRAEGNFFENIAHTFRAFVGSFFNDYVVDNGSTKKKVKNIEVWIASTTRDQYDIVQRLINNAYKDSDVGVKFKMVGADTITPSTLTGNGPDVAIQINSSMPTNFAFRGAGYDLTQFEDFKEVRKSFTDACMEYFEYQGGYYALPDQMTFPVVFYRKDIMKQLGLEIPNTWEELVGIIPYLQSQNLDVFFETTGYIMLGGASTTSTKPLNNIFLSLLYQNGEELYKEGGSKSNLDSEVALLTFKYWTEFYTKQSFQVAMDFVTRFRTGEIPLAVVDYTYYNTLMGAAPEIYGDWGIAPIPGTVRKDGTFDRSVSSSIGAAMIIKNTVESKETEQEAWEFLKWWVSVDTQVEYAKGQEAILGAAARYPVANIDAVDRLTWETEALNAIQETIKNMRGTPQVPGGYITGRNVESAFLSVVNKNLNPIDTLYSKIRFINEELKSKRIEFGLEDR